MNGKTKMKNKLEVISKNQPVPDVPSKELIEMKNTINARSPNT
jgi:hypothetical protein